MKTAKAPRDAGTQGNDTQRHLRASVSGIQEFLIYYKGVTQQGRQKATTGRQETLWVKRCLLSCLLNISEKARGRRVDPGLLTRE